MGFLSGRFIILMCETLHQNELILYAKYALEGLKYLPLQLHLAVFIHETARVTGTVGADLDPKLPVLV